MKTTFEEINLITLEEKEIFIENLTENHFDSPYPEKKVIESKIKELIKNTVSFERFVASSFIWSDTIQGRTYWELISKRTESVV